VGDEHLGFIVKRATEVRLATLFPRHAASAKVVDPVYFGEPEMAEAVLARPRAAAWARIPERRPASRMAQLT